MLPNLMFNNRVFSLASKRSVILGLYMSCFSVAIATSVDGYAAEPTVSVQTLSVQRAAIAQPVRGYGVVGAWAANLTTVNLSYPARLAQVRVQSGQAVSKGDPLCVVQADPAAALAAAQAFSAADLAQGELARTRSLLDEGLATRSQLATAAKAAEDARQALAAQRKAGIVTGDKIIRSPADGVVIQVSATQGDQLAAGAPILQLAVTDRARPARANVMLGVEPDQAARIRVGDAIGLRGVSVTSARSLASGKVVSIGAAVDPQTQLVDVGASVILDRSGLIPGTRVAADIGTDEGVHWIVPRAAVLQDERGAYLFQLDAGNRAKRIAVIIVIESGDRYGVEGPINGTRPIVVNGAYELRDGATTRPETNAVTSTSLVTKATVGAVQ